ncbi:GGDEF domain-containing protein [Roseococcus sp. SYP-B2431]|uniref:GGDEF domain-containing protein n=1 Tax=Roseococcus sp. SYP-B2431 TaxID=2496640 RepID=UPI00103C952B|nr:GGDEF domain-containing protein [Roseococcus sp. SYP-B2431]TCH97384.1 GGDEF domain-containing protein [Roseococcus sp. SYP-B2431]
MNGVLLLLTQAALYFCVMTLLLGLRRRVGIGVFVCALGVMHFLETYLAAVFFIELPFGLISPGSTVLFSGKLAMILLLYVIEDTETVRQPIYGLLIGNMLMVGLVLLLRFHEPAAGLSELVPDLMLIDNMGVLMVWGTTLLFIDSLAIVLLYEALSRRWAGRVFLPMLLSLGAVLTFDQIAFFSGLHLVAGTPFPALFGGWVAKMGAALTFALMAAAYLQWVEHPSADHPEAGTARLLGRLTYRHRYEALLTASRVDALTGAWNRQQFDSLGPARLARAAALGRPLGLAIVDLDNFKQVNDTLGHQSGDEALKRTVAAMKASIRPGDEVFRYGGDEFVVLAQDLRPADAAAYAERLRLAVAAEGGALPVTLSVSIGIAVFPRDAGGFGELMRRADQRLYDAKGLGRNQAISG